MFLFYIGFFYSIMWRNYMDTQRNYSCVDITGENVSQNVLGTDIYNGKCLRRMSVRCEKCDVYNPHTTRIATRSIFATCYFRECSKSTMTFDMNVDYGGSSVVIRLITRLWRVRRHHDSVGPFLL